MACGEIENQNQACGMDMGAFELMVAFICLCVFVLFILCCAAGVVAARLVFDDYRDLLRRARRRPRFGIGAMFTLVTIAAVACGIFRSISDLSFTAGTWFLALIALMTAIVVVCSAHFAMAAFFDDASRRQARDADADRRRLQPMPCDMDEIPEFPSRAIRP